MAKVEVRVMKNGVVVHRHEGAESWHDPSRKHGANPHYGVASDLHAKVGKAVLLKAEGIEKLNAEQQAQYVAALAGKTFWIYSKTAAKVDAITAQLHAPEEGPMRTHDLQRAVNRYGVGDDTRRARYEALVTARKACRACSDIANPSVIEGGIFDCNEIGAWSLWQGNLNAEVMVVGQDWGDVDWFLRVNGRPTSTSKTNTTLVELLAAAGLNINLANKTNGGGVLFFTNAVLCMKRGGAQAPVKPEWLRNCGTRFLRPMIDIVRPSVVVSLGAKAYRTVMTSHDMTPRKFSSAVESGEPDELPGGISVFAVYHCGAYVLNTNRKLAAQIEDWKRIGKFLMRTRSGS